MVLGVITRIQIAERKTTTKESRNVDVYGTQRKRTATFFQTVLKESNPWRTMASGGREGYSFLLFYEIRTQPTFMCIKLKYTPDVP